LAYKMTIVMINPHRGGTLATGVTTGEEPITSS